jgi:hypothetical protein
LVDVRGVKLSLAGALPECHLPAILRETTKSPHELNCE